MLFIPILKKMQGFFPKISYSYSPANIFIYIFWAIICNSENNVSVQQNRIDYILKVSVVIKFIKPVLHGKCPFMTLREKVDSSYMWSMTPSLFKNMGNLLFIFF